MLAHDQLDIGVRGPPFEDDGGQIAFDVIAEVQKVGHDYHALRPFALALIKAVGIFGSVISRKAETTIGYSPSSRKAAAVASWPWRASGERLP